MDRQNCNGIQCSAAGWMPTTVTLCNNSIKVTWRISLYIREGGISLRCRPGQMSLMCNQWWYCTKLMSAMLLKTRLHDTTCCQTGCQTNRFDNRLYCVYSRLSNCVCQTGCTTRFDNRLNEQLFLQHGCQTGCQTTLYNRLYRVNGVLQLKHRPWSWLATNISTEGVAVNRHQKFEPQDVSQYWAIISQPQATNDCGICFLWLTINHRPAKHCHQSQAANLISIYRY